MNPVIQLQKSNQLANHRVERFISIFFEVIWNFRRICKEALTQLIFYNRRVKQPDKSSLNYYLGRIANLLVSNVRTSAVIPNKIQIECILLLLIQL